ncbi:hypothetical protein HK405_007641 [Cladochytrium tenue]|nr:hypothetical protein HK405_007641 [Cladochytrium tenue]
MKQYGVFIGVFYSCLGCVRLPVGCAGPVDKKQPAAASVCAPPPPNIVDAPTAAAATTAVGRVPGRTVTLTAVHVSGAIFIDFLQDVQAVAQDPQWRNAAAAGAVIVESAATNKPDSEVHVPPTVEDTSVIPVVTAGQRTSPLHIMHSHQAGCPQPQLRSSPTALGAAAAVANSQRHHSAPVVAAALSSQQNYPRTLAAHPSGAT